MKTFRFLQKVFYISFFALTMAACGADDDLTDDNGNVKPDAIVEDPEGTISLSMMKGSSYKDATRLGNTYIYIGDDYNFKHDEGYGCQFVSLGTVKGLGNVSYIPTSGWASSVAVKNGSGYVACRRNYYSDNYDFYRIFVEDELVGTSGGIIGYEVKYQTPFKGKDVELDIQATALSFDENGGTEDIVFGNKDIVVFSAKSSADWCTVQKTSTYDQSFLSNGVRITVQPSDETTTTEATVTLTTAYGKEKEIKVTRGGIEPYISLNESSVTFDAKEAQKQVSLSTNIPKEDLEISNTASSWCTAEFVDQTRSIQAKAAMVKFVGDKPAKAMKASGSANYYTLSLKASANNKETERTGTVTLKSKDGKKSVTLDVTQKGITFVPSQTKVGFNKSRSNRTITIDTGIDWEATSNQSWCTLSKNGNSLTIRVTEYNGSAASRKATISFKGLSAKIEVNQSKYAVGDQYSENGVEGEVAYMNDTIRYVKKELGEAAWSTENVATGATDDFDGMKNMAVIKKIPDWENLYPAFALCDALNTGGVTGWYLPAGDEIIRITGEVYSHWSSTEYTVSRAYINDRGRYSGEHYRSIDKSEKYKVMAAHRF